MCRRDEGYQLGQCLLFRFKYAHFAESQLLGHFETYATLQVIQIRVSCIDSDVVAQRLNDAALHVVATREALHPLE